MAAPRLVRRRGSVGAAGPRGERRRVGRRDYGVKGQRTSRRQSARRFGRCSIAAAHQCGASVRWPSVSSPYAQGHVRRSGDYRVCGTTSRLPSCSAATNAKLAEQCGPARSLVRGACVWRLWTDCSAAAVVWSCGRSGQTHAHTPSANRLQRADVAAGGCIRTGIGMQSSERVPSALWCAFCCFCCFAHLCS